MNKIKDKVESIISDLQIQKQEEYCNVIKTALVSLLKNNQAKYDERLQYTKGDSDNNVIKFRKFFALKVFDINNKKETLQVIDTIYFTILDFIKEKCGENFLKSSLIFNIDSIEILKDRDAFNYLLRGILIAKINKDDMQEEIIDGQIIGCPCYINRPLHRYDKGCLVQSQAFKDQQTEEKPILRCDQIKNCVVKNNYIELRQYRQQLKQLKNENSTANNLTGAQETQININERIFDEMKTILHKWYVNDWSCYNCRKNMDDKLEQLLNLIKKAKEDKKDD